MKNTALFVVAILSLSLSWQCTQAQKLPRRPFFGARMLNINEVQKTDLQLPNTQGVYLALIVPQSSAAVANFQPKDVLVKINHQSITDVQQFLTILKKYKSGEKVGFEYYRQGKKYTCQMVFQEYPKMQSEDYEVVYSSVKAKSNHLRTIISKPKGQGKFPAVIIVQGIGCVTVDSPTHVFPKAVADALTRKGIVVMQIEKTGMGDSKGTPCRECTFEEELAGYKAGLAAIKKLDYVNPDQTFLFGFSMGGVIAPMIASENPVKGIIVYGTVARNWQEYEMENTRRQAEMTGTSYDQIADNMRIKERALHHLMVEKQAPQDIIAKYPETASFLRIYPQHYVYFQQVADVNLSAHWLKTNAHVLAVHGKADFVSFARDHALIARIVNGKTPGKARYMELPDSDHWLNKMGTMQQSMQNARNPKNTKNYRLLDIAGDWILRQSKT